MANVSGVRVALILYTFAIQFVHVTRVTYLNYMNFLSYTHVTLLSQLKIETENLKNLQKGLEHVSTSFHFVKIFNQSIHPDLWQGICTKKIYHLSFHVTQKSK